MTSQPHGPPALLEAIVRRVAKTAEVESLLGDLHEAYADMADATGRGRATAWYVGQIVQIVRIRLRKPNIRLQRHQQHRGSRVITTGFWNDVRGAFRIYSQRPGFTAVALGTIALGIGANTAIFSVVDSVALRELPYENPKDLYAIWPGRLFSKEMIVELREQTNTWSNVGGFTGWAFTITGTEQPAAINGAQVTGNYFSLLGVTAALGRTLVSADELPGAEPVVVLSHELWMGLFAGDSSIIGRTIQIGGTDHAARSVVGVMPTGYRDVTSGAQAWVPFLMDPTDEDFPRSWYVWAFGRLAHASTPALAQQQIASFANNARQTRLDIISEEQVVTATITPLQRFLIGGAATTMVLLAVAVGLVLLIACVNIANLLSALSSSREKEFAVRSALGAPRSRVVRQLLTESAVLGGVGGSLGIALGHVSFAVFRARAAEHLVFLQNIETDLRVIIFAFSLTLTCSLLFGLLPAIKSSRHDVTGSLKSDSRTASQAGAGRLTSTLVSAEVALAVVLTVGSGLMLRSHSLLNQVDPGFNTSVISMYLALPPAAFETPSEQRQFFRDLYDRLEGAPGMHQVGTVHILPMTNSNWSFPVYAAGYQPVDGTPPPSANFRIVGPGYFEAMQMPIVNGRSISSSDRVGSQPVGWINQTFAKEFWPEENPIGKQINLFSSGGPRFTVVGVVGDIKQHGLNIDTRPEMYRPYEQWTTGGTYLVARGSGNPEAIVPMIRETVHALDPNVPISDIRTLDQVLATTTAESKFIAELTAIFAVIALGMGAIGVYGVTSYMVGRRTREIGIRIALGAYRGGVLRRMFTQSMNPVFIGLGVGVVAALAAGRLVDSLLFGITATDVSVYLTATATIVVAAALAIAVPARRASNVDPNIALQLD